MSKHPMTRPPRLSEALLAWLLQDDLHIPVGDFEEYFHELKKQEGLPAARMWYRRQVLNLIPVRLYRKLSGSIVMARSYLLLSGRSLRKNKVASAINLFGLSTAIACTLVAYLFVYVSINAERVHVNGDSIYLVESVHEREGGTERWGRTPAPLGPTLAAELPQIERAVRMRSLYGSVDPGAGVTFGEEIRFADPAFLELFTFPIVAGDTNALYERGAAVLSTRTAERFFGDGDPIGRTLTIVADGFEETIVTVRAVAERNDRSALSFSVLLPYAQYAAYRPEADADWSEFGVFTFLKMADPGEVASLDARLAAQAALQRAASDDLRAAAFVADNLYDLTRHSNDVINTFAGSVPWAPVIVLSTIAMFLLLLSCINYMNISLSMAVRRVREIGMRKVVGGSRRQLAKQFLAENVLLCALSLLFGLVVAHFFLVPAFNTISGRETTLLTPSTTDLLVFLGGLLLGIALLSGAYPAFYLSSFRPITILRGTVRFRSKNRFMQALLTVQFVLAFVTMIVCIGLVQNAREQRVWDWGYTQEEVLFVNVEQRAQYEVMRNAAAALPQVRALAAAHTHIGHSRSTAQIAVGQDEMEVDMVRVSAAYPETMGLRLAVGRFFDAALESHDSREILVNESFARARNWDAPLGETVRIDSAVYDVIGVVSDFHASGFSDPIHPTIIALSHPESYRYLTLRVAEGAGPDVAAALDRHIGEQWPGTATRVHYQNAVFDRDFEETAGITRVFILTALLALLLSCMGLFGLAAQNTTSRMKEVGIRKVLGASLYQITAHLNRRFVVLIAIGALLATPLGITLLAALLDSIYTYRMDVGATPVLIAFSLVFVTGLLTITSQVYRLATAEPAATLRSD